jgi:methylmalonyl-CoA mutase N-terminal domain/subunit
VGVTVHVTDEDGAAPAMELSRLDPGVAERQISRTRRRVARRDAGDFASATRRLHFDAGEGRNVMPALIEAARAGVTVGEMSDVFRAAFGEFQITYNWRRRRLPGLPGTSDPVAERA